MSHFASKLDLWQTKMPLATVLWLTLSVVALHAAFGFNSGLETLYVLPIWLSIRLLTRIQSVLSLFAVTLVLSVAHPQLSGFSYPELIQVFSIRLLGFSIIYLLIRVFEEAFSKAKGLAFRDPLTGLLNRNGLAEAGERRLAAKIRRSTAVMIDCDGFKQINDRYGHRAGDHILQMLARILQRETRSTDTVVRMGGDEFAMVLHSATALEARVVLERIKVIFERAVADGGYECSISFGIAEGGVSEDLNEILARADEAMYQNKYAKKEQVPA